MTHPLDRAVWNALTTRLSGFVTADSDDRAVRIDPEVGVFLSGADATPESLAAMAALALAHPGAGMVEATGGPMAELDLPGVGVVDRIPLVQMVATALTPGGPDLAFEILTEADVPDMLALATLTRPGPFRSATRRLGPFIGIKQDGRLVAMAGRRLRVDGFTELSGVCTHPDWRGRGYAAGLSRAVAGTILASGEQVFLHAFAAHDATLAFYRSLGFEARIGMTYTLFN
ncbi:GNAT family N-acetyltransferase [Brevundimonas sp. LM2]|uniref:GNAT family N-acetyltransferase n=1 Tax=Brevundimonas sp. LM2 TaxID=1938605 RepID=UPI000983E407|nr:GNAT family N-acetyltransferase [Brevundimonas sp. LM2]AQR60301.1 GNAT family N-acetyltransferase [Brevundimonas sp. LM2]